MIGTLVNAGAIVLGGIIGLSSQRDLPHRQQIWMRTLLGALAVFVGFRMAWGGLRSSFRLALLDFGLALLALVLGNLAGKALGLQRQSNAAGRYAREQFEKARTTRKTDFAAGFVASAVLYCAGPFPIVGALQDGLQNDPRPLLVKAAMDGLVALGLVKVFGASTLLAALPMLAYQGTITLVAKAARPWVNRPEILNSVSVTGGLLVAMTALLILDVRKVPLADYLPSLIIAPLLWMLAA